MRRASAKHLKPQILKHLASSDGFSPHCCAVFFFLFVGMGPKLSSPIYWRIQTSARHVLDPRRSGGEEGRRDRHHGQTSQSANRPAIVLRAQLRGHCQVKDWHS